MSVQSIHRRSFRLGQSIFAIGLSFIATHVAAPPAAAEQLAAEQAATPQHVAQRAHEGPFTDLSGYWSGAGTITLANGASERIRCKATYSVNPSGRALNQSLRCASDSYRLEISSNVISEGGSVSGTWGEATRNVSGSISGRANGSQIQANLASAGFSAYLDVRTTGDKQSVTIRPQGGTEVSDVSILLRKV